MTDRTPGEEQSDPVRDRLRSFAFTPGQSAFDPTETRRRASARRRRSILSAVAAALVVIAIGGGVIASVIQDRVTSVEYADQPSPTSTPSPTQSRTTSVVPFAPEPKQLEDLPTGSVGSVLDGVRVDDVALSVTDCRQNEPCPDTATITVTNTEATEFRGIVIFTVYRNGRPTVGDGAGVTLGPGQSETVSISVQPQLSRNIPPNQQGSIYTWNIAVERQ